MVLDNLKKLTKGELRKLFELSSRPATGMFVFRCRPASKGGSNARLVPQGVMDVWLYAIHEGPGAFNVLVPPDGGSGGGDDDAEQLYKALGSGTTKFSKSVAEKFADFTKVTRTEYTAKPLDGGGQERGGGRAFRVSFQESLSLRSHAAGGQGAGGADLPQASVGFDALETLRHDDDTDLYFTISLPTLARLGLGNIGVGTQLKGHKSEGRVLEVHELPGGGGGGSHVPDSWVIKTWVVLAMILTLSMLFLFARGVGGRGRPPPGRGRSPPGRGRPPPGRGRRSLSFNSSLVKQMTKKNEPIHHW